MADEQIDELIIDVSVKGAEQANRQFDTMSQKIDELRRAIPKFDESLSRLANNSSISQAGKFVDNTTQSIKNAANSVDKLSDRWEYLNNPIERTFSTIEILNREIERMQHAYADTESEAAQDRLRKKIESTQAAIERNEKSYDKLLQTAEDVPSKQSKDWSYLNSELGRLQERLKTATAHMQELKEAWQSASTGSEQKSIEKELDRTAQTIDTIRSKIGKLPESTAKMFSQADAENFARMAEVATKDWDYLRSSTSILQSQIERLKSQIDELKNSWAKADGTAEQNKIAQQIENASLKLLNAQAKLNTMPKQGAEKFSQTDAERFANLANKAAKDWGYLQSPLGILEEQIRRITDETERYKKAWEKSTDVEEQDRLSNKIEANTEKIRKLTAEKENLEQPDETGGGLQGLLSNVQGIAAMFGKTGGQISGLIGKASNLGGVLQGVAGKAAGIAIPVGVIVGLVSAIKKGAEAIMQTAKTVYSVAKKIANVIGKEIKNKINELVEPIKRIKDRIGRVIFNRLIREAFNLIQNGIAEGLKNVARGFDRANVALSQYSTQITYLKNTIGAMFIPVLETLYPVFESVTNAVIKASNAINQFMSLISGKGTYIKAQKQYVNYADSIDSSSKKAKKSMQNLLASFDELHDITESATDTGTEGDYTQFFTEAGIETNIDAFYKRLRDGFKKGDLSSVGVDLADKLNAQLEKFINFVKWDNVKEKITTKISAITSGLRSFLKTFIENNGFENLGKSVGNGLNTIVKSLVTFGEEMRAKLTEINGISINGFAAIGVGIADTVYGMIMSIDWEAVGTLLLEEIIKIFDIAKGFAARMLENVVYNGETMTRIEAMVTKLMQGLASALETAIEKSEFTSMGETIGNMLIVIFQAGAAIFTKSKFWENLATAVNNVISALAKKMQDPNFLSALTDFVVATVNGVATLLSSIDLGKVLNAISNVITKLSKDPQVTNAISNFASVLGNIAGELFVFKFKLKFVKIISFIDAISAGLAGIIRTISSKIIGERNTNLIHNSFQYWTPSFATGGFPEDGLFYANHNELVGSFSNGKTAVANNMQIVDGIKQGVKEAMVESRGTQSSSTQLTGDMIIDGKKAGKILAKSVGEELNRSGFKLRKA